MTSSILLWIKKPKTCDAWASWRRRANKPQQIQCAVYTFISDASENATLHLIGKKCLIYARQIYLVFYYAVHNTIIKDLDTENEKYCGTHSYIL